ncbi:hypothetical protein B0T20DRAFT_31578 [Sordaria brevicollis]|uniref:Uncharacterized protein n=1 Tax=Sordaria brevicollis TaxID=83679 RepID=A0AAE0P938_SORBR|nr:hypothetical protein B0T20DRAFT_31578 [Sordaria brevicollis]
MATELIGYFGFSCPAGGSYYMCVDSKVEFIGCCTVNPCTEERGGVCPDERLRVATFSSAKYEEIPAQMCAVVTTEALWYTCNGTTPPFLGCCVTNPCRNGNCPTDDLRPAILNNNASDPWPRTQLLNPKGSGVSYGGSKTDPSSSSSSSASEPTSSSTNQPANDTNTSESSGGLSTGAIAGIAVGAVLAILLIVAGLVWKCGWFPRKKKAEATKQEADLPGAAMSHAGPMSPMSQHAYPHQGHQGYGYADESGRSVMSSPSTGYIRDSYVSGLTAPGSQHGPISPALSKAGLHSQHASPNLRQDGFDQKFGYNGYNGGYQNNGLGLDTVSELPVTDQHHGAQELPAGNYPGFEMDAGAVQPPQEQKLPQGPVSQQEGHQNQVKQEQDTQNDEPKRS